MRLRILTLFLMIAALLAVPCFAQTAPEPAPTQLLGAGVNWNQFTSQNQISGDLVYAYKISDNNDYPTYNFNIVDIVSKSRDPFTTAVSVTPGVAQQVFKFNGLRFFGLATAGLSVAGSSTDEEGVAGFSWSTGGAVSIPYKKVIFVPMFRALKTSTSSDFQAVYGLNILLGSK